MSSNHSKAVIGKQNILQLLLLAPLALRNRGKWIHGEVEISLDTMSLVGLLNVKQEANDRKSSTVNAQVVILKYSQPTYSSDLNEHSNGNEAIYLK